VRRTPSCSRDKNKSLVRVPSNSKLPKDFFRPDDPPAATPPAPAHSMPFDFTFMRPLSCLPSQLARKPVRDLKVRPLQLQRQNSVRHIVSE
jgi:hypothetical protein